MIRETQFLSVALPLVASTCLPLADTLPRLKHLMARKVSPDVTVGYRRVPDAFVSWTRQVLARENHSISLLAVRQ